MPARKEQKNPLLDFRPGLNTTVAESAWPLVFREFRDWRADGGSAKRRNGSVKIGSITSDSTIIDFDGTNDRVDLIYNGVQVLGTTFTLEWLCKADALSGDHFVIGKTGATGVGVTVKQTSSNTLVVVVTDSGATSATLTASSITTSTTAACRLTRSGESLVLYVNGAQAATGTIGAATTVTLALTSVATDNGANWYDGRCEWWRGFSIVRTGYQDLWSRLYDARTPSVLFDFVFDSTDFARDRSKNLGHGVIGGSPGTSSTLLSVNPVPIQAIELCKDVSVERKGYVVGAGKVYPVTVN